LEARISELENELRIWKQAHAKVLALAENESNAHKARLVSLSHKVATMNSQASPFSTVKNHQLKRMGKYSS
jgi:hypothetical protein